MLGDVLSTIDAACSFAEPALVSRAARARLRSAAEGLPAGMVGGFLECPLATRGERVDLLLAARADAGGLERLARSEAWPESIRRAPAWQGVLTFWSRWADRRAALFDRIPLALIEFDLEDDAQAPRLPGFHFCVDPAFAKHGWDAPPEAPAPLSAADLATLASDVLGTVTGVAPSPECLAALERCRAALPAGGRLLHLSAMLSRQDIPRKLNAVLPSEQLVSWLDAIGWPGDLELPARLLARFALGQRLAKVDVALGASIGPRLGLELCFPGHPASDPRWLDLLDRLVADGLCTSAQGRALTAWPGADELALPGVAWPARIERSLEIKLVADEGAVQAKAYLGFTTRLSLFAPERPAVAGQRGDLAPLLRDPAIALPEPLITPQARERVEAAARLLPGGFSSWALEVRLAPGIDQVDLLACARADDASPTMALAFERAGWAKEAAFLERWLRPEGALRRTVPSIWLELDLPDDRPPQPSVSVAVMARAPGGRGAEDLVRRTVCQVLEALDAPFGEAAVEGAMRCVRLLPGGSRLNHLGVMRGRPAAPLRLALELPPTALRAYLRELGWEGTDEDLAPLSPALARGVDRLGLALDMTEDAPRRVGLELVYLRPSLAEPRFRALLEDLTAHEACDPRKRAALASWSGVAQIRDGRRFERGVWHVKCVIEPGAPLLAKSYLFLAAVAAPDLAPRGAP
ncbi:hypothetical protein [Sorangium sp. So ce233]|uniref:hypothetical protein n=1 Tax=Sorangium sp. So ce233 TaxID=3133290 RepID=UPI003F621D26